MVDAGVVSLVGVLGLFALLAMGLEVAFTLGLLGLLGLYFTLGHGVPETGIRELGAVGTIFFTNSNSFVLTAIPLFVLMGAFLLHSGLGATLFDAGQKWFGWLPGGPIVGTIAANAVFGAISGSSTAAAATFGTVAMPELIRQGFNRQVVKGAIASAGTLAILIPPSVTLILYGAMTEQSIGRLFIAGAIPGIVLATLFSIYTIGLALVRPAWSPTTVGVGWRERFLAIKDLVPAMVLIVAVLGGIYAGVTTPTEAAAVGAFCAMLLALLNRRLTLPVLESALLDAARTTSMIMFIVVSALVAGHVITKLGLPLALNDAIRAANLSPWAVFWLLCGVYLILGMLIDSVSMIVMTLPLVGPLMEGLGFDMIWYGVIVVVLVELSLITPPVGLNLYIIHGLRKDEPFAEVALGSLPYTMLLGILIVMLVLWPDMALWLPSVLTAR